VNHLIIPSRKALFVGRFLFWFSHHLWPLNPAYGAAMEKIPMTRNGYDRLSEELKELKAVQRPNVIKAIAEAREQGDLSENAEYHAARERQSFIEGRIGELEDKISRAEVIDITALSGKDIKFGATVTLVDEDTEEKVTYQLVGQDEADIKKGLLSVTSPLGRALINKKVKDNVEITTPGGTKAYEVLKILYK
jgi:transcription elongation factor GreA